MEKTARCPGGEKKAQDPVKSLAVIVLIFFRSEKVQNESSPKFLSVRPGFSPEFSSEFPPHLLRIFRALFPRKRRPQKIHKKIPCHYSMPNPQANANKLFTQFFWRGGKVKLFSFPISEGKNPKQLISGENVFRERGPGRP